MAGDCVPRSLALRRCARALIVAILLVPTWSGHARAHGAASWIMQDPDHGWCCGPEDCFWLERKEVTVEEDFYVVDRLALRWPIAGTFRSIDQRYWVCTFMRGTRFEQVKCFFAPRPPAM